MSSRLKWQQLFRLSLQKSCMSCRLYSRSARLIFSFRQTSGRTEGAIGCQGECGVSTNLMTESVVLLTPASVVFNCDDGNSFRAEMTCTFSGTADVFKVLSFVKV